MISRSTGLNHAAPSRPTHELESVCAGSSLARVYEAVERLQAGDVAAIFTGESGAVSVHLVVSAELVDARALELLVTLGGGPLRLASAEQGSTAAAAVDLVRMTGSIGGALWCEINERVIAPLRLQALEDWSETFNLPVVSSHDIVVARSTLAKLGAHRSVAANDR